MTDFTEMRNRARSLLNDEAKTWLESTADQTARDLLALCAEVERFAQQVRGMRSQHTPLAIRRPHKPQSRDGCGDENCQWCAQYNWSDPGR